MNVVTLVLAIAAALIFGVAAAHALCRTAFAIFRAHAISVANNKLEKAEARS